MHTLNFEDASPALAAAVHDLIAREMAGALLAGRIDRADRAAVAGCLGENGFGQLSIDALTAQAIDIASDWPECAIIETGVRRDRSAAA